MILLLPTVIIASGLFFAACTDDSISNVAKLRSGVNSEALAIRERRQSCAVSRNAQPPYGCTRWEPAGYRANWELVNRGDWWNPKDWSYESKSTTSQVGIVTRSSYIGHSVTSHSTCYRCVGYASLGLMALLGTAMIAVVVVRRRGLAASNRRTNVPLKPLIKKRAPTDAVGNDVV